VIMDPKSHELFAQVLLEVTDETNTSPKIWGNAPDIDMKFFHRWYRHRISALPDIYKENLKGCEQEIIDKDAIVLCIVSHDYLDIFNGLVFPFGLWHPIYPEETVINDVLNDLDDPKLLVADLEKLSGYVSFTDMFYAESKGIMQEFVRNIKVTYIPSITEIIVRRLAMHSENNYGRIYKKAMNDIGKFTENDIYSNIRGVEAVEICEQFEINYAYLINKVMSC
jgi:hypothetical protein